MIVAQARQGLDRIELLVKTQRQQAIAQATADPDRTQKGVLVLEPIASDRNYMFHNGIAFSEQQTHNQTTVKINWNHLQNFLARKLERAEFCSDFTIFAETFLDRSDLLAPIPSHIHLFRRDPSNWDAAFHLYSGLVFLKGGRN